MFEEVVVERVEGFGQAVAESGVVHPGEAGVDVGSLGCTGYSAHTAV